MENIRLEELTSKKLSDIFESKTQKIGFLLPVGCFEQHGPILPLGCDTHIAKGAAENLALNLNDNKIFKAFVLPEFTYTPSPGAEETTGTISVDFEWLGTGLKQIIDAALTSTPWDFAAIINSHAHNQGRIYETSVAASKENFGKKFPVIVINIYEYANLTKQYDLEPGNHAGEFEIALYKYYKGDLPSHEILINDQSIKQRPAKIYGLDILSRSIQGIISPKLPDVNKAIAAAEKVGQLIDAKLKTELIENLTIYFENWQ